jgi:hypothetical protein
MNYIYDSLWELWQYFKPNPCMYIAGLYYFDRLILVKMIPENLPLPTGWQQLTQSMTKAQAVIRMQNFKLIKIVETEKSPNIGT